MFIMGLIEDFLDVGVDKPIVYTITRTIIGVLMLLVSTHCFTTGRYVYQSLVDRRYQGKEPATLPYSLPWIGSALQVTQNTHKFYDYVTTKSPDGAPIRLRLGSIHAYLIFGARNVQAVFRNSKDLTFEEFALRVAQKVKRLPAADAAIIGADKSGSATRPLTETPNSLRIWRKFHEIYETNLTGSIAVSSLTHRFIDEFVHQIDSLSIDTWKSLKVNELLQDSMLVASTTTLAGPAIFDIAPDFAKCFWDYDEAFMPLLYGLPRYLCRKGWDARDRALEVVKTYLQQASEKIDWEETRRSNPDWEANYGSRLVRAREEAMMDYGISLGGRAAFELGLIWSINSNAIPMTSWIVIEILSRPGLIDQIRAEISHAITVDPETGLTRVDIPTLTTLPLLHSVYSECLRLRASIQVVRQLRNDVQIDGYTLKAGNLIIAPSWIAHQDPSVWSNGPEGHLAHEFWPERFLHRTKTVESGNYFPYGGGTAACPGRYYAKQEILAAAALLIQRFDFEPMHFVREDDRKSDRAPKVGNEARGVARIDRDLLVRMRRTSPRP